MHVGGDRRPVQVYVQGEFDRRYMGCDTHLSTTAESIVSSKAVENSATMALTNQQVCTVDSGVCLTGI